MPIFTEFETGTVTARGEIKSAADLPWNQHPTFVGVALKHLVTGAETGGAFSAHLVRLDPNAEIEDHIHETNWELHEVAEGSGVCVLEGDSIPYAPGRVAVMPQKALHRVRAGQDGLCLLAKFVPALL
ncbi:cupin domain-containing protein [uncultured Pseudodesulfovibrio sp.]|uniref:cupin domain-containing protein n=1 Tax=uncultured Pseudodesulfovibrio sp. TaxID=2035858 RepID=UPI0029C78F2C|nr:cupin domain-containing protein [uncultured Pseudodesulfovibrio sp.]